MLFELPIDRFRVLREEPTQTTLTWREGSNSYLLYRKTYLAFPQGIDIWAQVGLEDPEAVDPAADLVLEKPARGAWTFIQLINPVEGSVIRGILTHRLLWWLDDSPFEIELLHPVEDEGTWGWGAVAEGYVVEDEGVYGAVTGDGEDALLTFEIEGDPHLYTI